MSTRASEMSQQQNVEENLNHDGHIWEHNCRISLFYTLFLSFFYKKNKYHPKYYFRNFVFFHLKGK